MTIHFDPDRRRWRFDFWRDGVRHRGYCLDQEGRPAGNKTEARRAEERIKARLQAMPGATAQARADEPIFGYAADLYLAQAAGGRHAGNQQVYMAELLRWFGPDAPIAEIEERVAAYNAWALAQPVRIWRGGARSKADPGAARLWTDAGRTRSAATQNRYLDALRRAIRLYGEIRDPATGKPRLEWLPKIPALKEIQRIPRAVSDADLETIAGAGAAHLVDAARLARHMGFRKTEMLSIELGQVDLANRCVWLKGEDTKGKRDEAVPANKAAMKILARRVAEARRLKIPWLFWWVPPGLDADGRPKPPRPVRNLQTAWEGAQRRAGLEHAYRFHDLKASYVTGVGRHASLRKTQELARHRDPATTMRYLAVLDGEGRDAVEAAGRDQARAAKRKSVGDSVGETSARSGRILPLKARRTAAKSRA